jgi:GT2 family glycosyltransferase
MLESLIKTIPQGIDFEIILINDASIDNTREWLQTLNFSNMKIIHNEKNQGYAKSNNIAAKSAEGDVLALLNNDLIFEGDWLSPMLEILSLSELKAGIVGNIQYKVSTNEIDHAGIELCNKAQFVHIHNIDNTKDYSRQLAVTGACMLIRREDFDKVNGFSEVFINGCEDLDLCFKVKSLGKMIYLAHKSAIQHHVSMTRNLTNIQNEINSRLLLKKWRSLIKQELSQIWSRALFKDEQSFINEHFDGKLLIHSPHVASRIIAENLIRREEHRWDKLIDKNDDAKRLNDNCLIKGLRYVESHTCYLIDESIVVTLKNIYSVVNFYLVGQVINPDLKEDIAITIKINELQEKTVYLDRQVNINAGIIYPIFMSEKENIIKVSINFYNPDNKALLDDARKSIVVRHFVLDEFTIQPKK